MPRIDAENATTVVTTLPVVTPLWIAEVVRLLHEMLLGRAPLRPSHTPFSTQDEAHIGLVNLQPFGDVHLA